MYLSSCGVLPCLAWQHLLVQPTCVGRGSSVLWVEMLVPWLLHIVHMVPRVAIKQEIKSGRVMFSTPGWSFMAMGVSGEADDVISRTILPMQVLG